MLNIVEGNAEKLGIESEFGAVGTAGGKTVEIRGKLSEANVSHVELALSTQESLLLGDTSNQNIHYRKQILE